MNSAINDACTKNVEFGKITEYSKCEYLKQLTKERKGKEVAKFRLETDKATKKITFCCPERKAVVACKTFGKRPEEPTAEIGLIIGGNKAAVGEFPHFAAIAMIENYRLSFECGGALITNQYVLSAAHCCNKLSKKPIIVRLGKVGEASGVIHIIFNSKHFTNRQRWTSKIKMTQPSMWTLILW